MKVVKLKKDETITVANGTTSITYTKGYGYVQEYTGTGKDKKKLDTPIARFARFTNNEYFINEETNDTYYAKQWDTNEGIHVEYRKCVVVPIIQKTYVVKVHGNDETRVKTVSGSIIPKDASKAEIEHTLKCYLNIDSAINA